MIAAGAALGAVTIAQPATAASTFACTNYAYSYILAVGSGSTDKGALYSYAYSPTDKDTLGTFQPRTKIGNSGWDQFGAIRGGSAGFLWAFKSDGTLHAYDWAVGGTSWSRSNTVVAPPSGATSPWASYTSAAGKKKVTVDNKNQIFTLDSSGRILKYGYSFTTNSWTTWARPVVQLGSTAYDMLWASDNTTLWARKTDGTLTRLRIDPTSDRVIDRFDGGSGWGSFKNIFTAGGDTIYTIVNNAGLKKYRFNEDARAWANNGIVLSTSTGWSGFLDTTAVANTCSRGYVVPTTTVSPDLNAPIEALGSTSSGNISLAYSNAVGELRYALLSNSETNTASFTVVNDSDATTGRPALTQSTDGLAHLFSHTNGGLTKEKVQLEVTKPGLGGAIGQGGVLTGHADAAVMSNGTTVLAATDAQGVVWVRQQIGTQYSAWRTVAKGAAPSAAVTVQAGAVNKALVYTRTSDGRVLATTVDSAGLSTPAVDLGAAGAGATGSVAALSYAGGAQRIAVTDASGQVWTKSQDIGSLAWGSSWTPVAVAGGGAVVGSPSIVLSPVTSRVQVVARQLSDNQVVVASETEQASGTFSELAIITDAFAQPAADPRSVIADPTTFTYLAPDGQRRWGIVSYDSGRNLWAWYATASQTIQLQRAVPGATGESTQESSEVLVERNLGRL